MAGGSVCLSEHMPEEVQARILARNKDSIITYTSVEDCYNKARFILQNSRHRMKVAMKSFNLIKDAKESSLNLSILAKELLKQSKTSTQAVKKKDLLYLSKDGMLKAREYEDNQQLDLEMQRHSLAIPQ